jgi:phenylalanyl-tRNA synthetase beta chain
MSAITIDKKELLKLAGKKLSDKELDDRLSMMGVPVDAVLDTEVQADIAPNRPDWLSEQGLARSLKSFLGIKAGLKQYKTEKEKYSVIVDKSVNPVRPYTACAVVKGLKLDDAKIRAIIQAQEKLHLTCCRNRKKAAIGIYPLEKISFPIRYLAKKPEEIVFVPLESQRQMNAKQLLAQHPTGRAYAHLLEGQQKFPVFIDAKGQVLSVPPIINSHRTGKVETSTKDVFIECSGFDLRSLSTLLNIIVTMLADMGGRIASVEVNYGKKIRTPDLSPRKMKINRETINSLLGLELSEAEMKRLLERMGFGYQNKQVLIPAYRADILHEVDIAEDIAIAYGYERLKPEIPQVATIGSADRFLSFQNKIASLLTGLGLSEVLPYHLTTVVLQTKMMQYKTEVIELANALTTDYNALRAWLLPSLMDVLRANKMKDYPQKFFTTGTVFSPNKKTPTQVGEDTVLGIVSAHSKSDYTEIRQFVEYLFRVLNIKVSFEETEHGSFIQGRAASIIMDSRKIGIIGEVHPQVITNFGLEMPASAAEICLHEVFARLQKP